MYFNHQRCYLQPCISSVWKQHQEEILDQLKHEKRGLVLGGDGRADTPGHCAKFGLYTLMELEKQIVLDVQLIHVSSKHHTSPTHKLNYIRAMKLVEVTTWRRRAWFMQ